MVVNMDQEGLARVRRLLGWKDVQLYRSLGIPHRTYYRWKAGKQKVNRYAVQRINELLAARYPGIAPME